MLATWEDSSVSFFYSTFLNPFPGLVVFDIDVGVLFLFFSYRDRSTLYPKMTRARLTWLLITCHRRWPKKRFAPCSPPLAKSRVANSSATKSQVLILRSMMVDNLSTVWNFILTPKLSEFSKNQPDFSLFFLFPFALSIWKQGRVWVTDSSITTELKMPKKP